MDINLVIKELSKERECFSSEVDFQFALAWKIKELYKEAEIILEQYALLDHNGKYSYIDLVVKLKNRLYPIELKYLTSELEYLHFKLKNQSAQDVRSYDVIKDIERIEHYCLKKNIENGYVIVLTNDKSYWKSHSEANSKTNAYNFNLGHERILEGLLTWAEKTSLGTNKGREKSLNLKGEYHLLWKEYSSIKIKNGLFKVLIVNINPEEGNISQHRII